MTAEKTFYSNGTPNENFEKFSFYKETLRWNKLFCRRFQRLLVNDNDFVNNNDFVNDNALSIRVPTTESNTAKYILCPKNAVYVAHTEGIYKSTLRYFI